MRLLAPEFLVPLSPHMLFLSQFKLRSIPPSTLLLKLEPWETSLILLFFSILPFPKPPPDLAIHRQVLSVLLPKSLWNLSPFLTLLERAAAES